MPVKVSQILPPPTRIPVGDQFLEVRGLTLPEVVALIAEHRMHFVRMLVLARSGTPDFVEMLAMAPSMASEILCYATNSKGIPEEEQAVVQLPAGVQLIALTEIWKLTVTDQKKIQGLLSQAMAELRRLNASAIASGVAPVETPTEQTSEVLPLKNAS